jgi:hypothetical protein
MIMIVIVMILRRMRMLMRIDQHFFHSERLSLSSFSSAYKTTTTTTNLRKGVVVIDVTTNVAPLGIVAILH